MKFLGRQHELELMRSWAHRDEATLTVLYGRRRVGKTRLVEEAYRNQNIPLLTFEGVEGYSSREQRTVFLSRLAQLSQRAELAVLNSSRWTDVLTALVEYIAKTYGNKPVVVLFDEFQWMAAGQKKLVSALKYVWDLHFKKRTRVHLVLCGSIGSFLVRKVLRSRALYGRVDNEMALQPLAVNEILDVFRPRRSLREVIELYMAVGGIPQYLQLVDGRRSTRVNLERLCFSRHGALVDEFERIFLSHFGSVPHYRSIVKVLGQHGQADRKTLLAACGTFSGGSISTYLEDLELAGFIERYAPIDKPQAVRNTRYRLRDHYIDFYFRFIQPSLKKIRSSSTKPRFSTFVSEQRYAIWCGLAFERLCRFHHGLLAKALGFSSIDYECGSWFTAQQGPKAQVDLLFSRADKVMTLCELKFQRKNVGKSVVEEVRRKIELLPSFANRTIEPVLVSASPPTKDLVAEDFFHQILGLDAIFE